MDATESPSVLDLMFYERLEQPDVEPSPTRSSSWLDLNSWFNRGMGTTLSERFRGPLWTLGQNPREIAMAMGRPESDEATRQMLLQVPDMVAEVAKNLGLPEPKELGPDSSITGFVGGADERGHWYMAAGRISMNEKLVQELIEDPASLARWMDSFPRQSQGLRAELIHKFNALDRSGRKSFMAKLRGNATLDEEAHRFLNTREHFRDGEHGYLFGGAASVVIDGHRNLRVALSELPGDELVAQTWNARTTDFHAFSGTLQWTLMQNRRDPNALYWSCIGAGRGWGLPADRVNNNFVRYTWKTMAETLVFKHKNGIAGAPWITCNNVLQRKDPELWSRRHIQGLMAPVGFGTWLHRTILDWSAPEVTGAEEVKKSMVDVAEAHDMPFAAKPTEKWTPGEVFALDRLQRRTAEDIYHHQQPEGPAIQVNGHAADVLDEQKDAKAERSGWDDATILSD